MLITIDLLDRDEPSLGVLLSANFTFVARDRTTGKAAPINALRPTTDAEVAAFDEADARVARLKAARKSRTAEEVCRMCIRTRPCPSARCLALTCVRPTGPPLAGARVCRRACGARAAAAQRGAGAADDAVTRAGRRDADAGDEHEQRAA
eukprot:466912-Prymnesium_polylepis.1